MLTNYEKKRSLRNRIKLLASETNVFHDSSDGAQDLPGGQLLHSKDCVKLEWVCVCVCVCVCVNMDVNCGLCITAMVKASCTSLFALYSVIRNDILPPQSKLQAILFSL